MTDSDVIIRAKSDDHIPHEVRQTLVMRKLYPDGNGGTRKVRAGKLAAQAAHASMAWLSRRVCESAIAQNVPLERLVGKPSAYPGVQYTENLSIGFTTEERAWLTGKFTKIVLGIDTEEELLALYEEVKAAGLTVHLITDSGMTEFHGEPTVTGIGIGPHNKSRIDPFTKDLSPL